MEEIDEDLSIGPDGNIRSGYDQPVTAFEDELLNDTQDERWSFGARAGQPVTDDERRAIARHQIARWRKWARLDETNTEAMERLKWELEVFRKHREFEPLTPHEARWLKAQK